ncbi:receptor-like serine/threonine-protein kinase SD1-8 [Diospyros lotus]|uniref:receptor-like serine/threonine-protein kinase SD1-8 n=1 Tax=Diospyros lotus TaxID=55363 RepID=UPI0022566A1A|nr:receptor-like serine/threonine-protein kinase SD1-8 [Diospyros lotus]
MRNSSELRHAFSNRSWLCISAVLALIPIAATGLDAITATQPLKHGETLVSAGEVFELGFFSPGSSGKWFLGVWYKQIQARTYVWVANRDSPLSNSSPVLKIGEDGNLILTDESSIPVWSSNFQRGARNLTTVARILDSGNLVVRQENDENYLWQSFDHPTDTLLPEMKLGWDAKTGLNRSLTSWKTAAADPSSGNFSFKMDINGFPEFFLWNGQSRIYRSGPWNGLRFSGVPEMNTSDDLKFHFWMNSNETAYSFSSGNKSVYSRLVVEPSGKLQRYAWIETAKQWKPYWFAPKDQCDTYRECGIYGVCDNSASPVCQCQAGFEPKFPRDWNLRDGSAGCVRKTKLNCRDDKFLALKNMKLPDTSTAFVDKRMSLEDCKRACRRNCSCTAYANMYIAGGGSGCVIWGGHLLDMREYAASEGGQDLFVRVSASDSDESDINSSHKSKGKIKILGIAVAAGIVILLLLGLSLYFVWRKKIKQRDIQPRGPHERSQDYMLNKWSFDSKRDFSGEATSDEFELPMFDVAAVAIATNEFSDDNKLGEGGFGCVYKGLLAGGQKIAVKRLSKNSGQGTEEFRNEVKLVARLQHRNLVRLLGFCIGVEEKMLIYEYMENKSLDFFLFNEEKRSQLDWQTRFDIICGVARGLLYLHQDSRFRIIHRDLKASNVLLDGEMNAKISDFGMARIFGGDQTEASTRRIVGTYGYMSPEYAMDGLFSVKSDVFSFGVLVLEIISGKKNQGFYYTNEELNLLGYAWGLWMEGKGLELMDSSLGDSFSPEEVMRCVRVGLLCVQERAEDRPTMASVGLMLRSENASMSQPKHPGFCLGRKPVENDALGKQDESFTLNQVTVTILDGR